MHIMWNSCTTDILIYSWFGCRLSFCSVTYYLHAITNCLFNVRGRWRIQNPVWKKGLRDRSTPLKHKEYSNSCSYLLCCSINVELIFDRQDLVQVERLFNFTCFCSAFWAWSECSEFYFSFISQNFTEKKYRF